MFQVYRKAYIYIHTHTLWSESEVTQSCLIFATSWTVAHQAPRSMGFSRHEYWSGLPFSSSGIFPTQELNPGLPRCGQRLYRLSHQGSPRVLLISNLIQRLCKELHTANSSFAFWNILEFFFWIFLLPGWFICRYRGSTVISPQAFIERQLCNQLKEASN